MKYTIPLLIALLSFLGLSAQVRAEDNTIEVGANADVQLQENNGEANVGVDANGNLTLPPPADGAARRNFMGHIEVKRGEVRDRLEMERGKIKMYSENRQEKLGEIKSKMETRMKDMRASFKETMQARFSALVTRFTKLFERLDSRIAKMKAAGADTATAETSLAQAKSQLQAAISVAATITLSDTMDAASMDANKAALEGIKTQMKTVEASLKQTVDALKAIRGSVTLPGLENSNNTQ